MLTRIQAAYARGNRFGPESTGSWPALRYMPYDLMNSPVGGQVGGDAAQWHAFHGQIYVDITNDAGAKSFFFHAFPNFPDDLNGPLTQFTKSSSSAFQFKAR